MNALFVSSFLFLWLSTLPKRENQLFSKQQKLVVQHMSELRPYCFACLQKHPYTTPVDLITQHQQFAQWLATIEAVLAPLPIPIQTQYDQQGILIIWEASSTLLPFVEALEPLVKNSTIAVDQGLAIYDKNRQWCCSNIPERLPALLQVGKHYQSPLVIGEEACHTLPKTALSYLTRSYFLGSSTAIGVYAWQYKN